MELCHLVCHQEGGDFRKDFLWDFGRDFRSSYSTVHGVVFLAVMMFKTPEESGNDMALMLLFFAEHGAYCSFLVVAAAYFQIKSGIFRRRDTRRFHREGSCDSCHLQDGNALLFLALGLPCPCPCGSLRLQWPTSPPSKTRSVRLNCCYPSYHWVCSLSCGVRRISDLVRHSENVWLHCPFFFFCAAVLGRRVFTFFTYGILLESARLRCPLSRVSNSKSLVGLS